MIVFLQKDYNIADSISVNKITISSCFTILHIIFVPKKETLRTFPSYLAIESTYKLQSNKKQHIGNSFIIQTSSKLGRAYILFRNIFAELKFHSATFLQKNKRST